MSLGFRIGLTIFEWNEMTPAQLSLAVKAYAERIHSEQEAVSLQNYNLANLIRVAVWGKRMPEYSSPFREEKKQKKRASTDEELFAAVCALNASMGGKFEG